VAARPVIVPADTKGNRLSSGESGNASRLRAQQWIPCGCTPMTYCLEGDKERPELEWILIGK
jgi:hypothetical protein